MSASFHEIQFPPRISQGAVGGPGFSTTVTTLASGFEQRNQNWSKSRAVYDVAKGLQSQEDLNELLRFFFARRGKAIGFRFKDWADFRLPNWESLPGDIEALPLFVTTNGTQSQFQLVKDYVDAGGSYRRTIAKPVPGTVGMLLDGDVFSDWSVDTTTGVITLGDTTKATTGKLVTGYCEFDVPVRFDTDQMQTSIEDYEIFSWGQIPIVEVRV